MTTTRSPISVILPAFNEEDHLGPTLDSVTAAREHLGQAEQDVEIIVVDNGSTDRTAEVARSYGVRVVQEPRGNVAIARNAGARAAHGEILVFVDADTLWPETLLSRIATAMSDVRCMGGAVDTDYRPRRLLVRWYLRFWRIAGKLFRMAQGATQFCRASLFASLGGYDESWYMGEDVEFYWRMRKAARQADSHVLLIDDVRVVPSCRRFDKWPLWKTLLLTNPLTCWLFSRRRGPWDAVGVVGTCAEGGEGACQER